MYAKIYAQIFDSSIAENYELRHFFEDMLKLADITGVVDMTPEAIHRRINLPLEKVVMFLEMLQQPDEKSRSAEHEGRRLVPLDSHRDWGWVVVNYEHYRRLRDEEARRAHFRDAKRRQREKAGKPKRNGKPLPGEEKYVRTARRKGIAAADAQLDASQNGKAFAEDFNDPTQPAPD